MHIFNFRLTPLRLILGGILLVNASTVASARPETSQDEAVENVKAILRMNTDSCKIDRIRSVTALRTREGWRVTAKLVMSASGKPLNETAIWLVGFSSAEAVPANQLTAEISNGCP